MKKRLCILLTLLMLGIIFTCVTAGAEETESGTETETSDIIENKSLGFNMKSTTLWDGLKGTLIVYPISSTSINNDPEIYGAYLYYFPVSEEEMEDEDEENVAGLMEKMTVPGFVFTIKGDHDEGVEALIELFQGEISKEDADERLVEIGEADGYHFFTLIQLDDEYAASLDEEYAEDYNNLPELVVKEMKQSEFYAPIDAMKALEGEKISFTSTDLDGNTVTSEELFKDNEITMVNLWGVWCINCVNEMEELAEINTRIQEKGCGIVGIEWEEEPGEETYQKARDLLKEKGTNYPSVLMPEGVAAFEAVSGFPTTFYVDREGTILTKPIVGAKVKEYEPTLETLLEGKSVPETESAAAGTFSYRVLVKDEEGQPIEEVTVQFCDENACRLGETDEDGCAVFEVSEEKNYEIHVVDAPEGYAYDEEEVISAGDASSDTTIVLKKE
jgi:thiol-disulfide isomerase/thioredoxin